MYLKKSLSSLFPSLGELVKVRRQPQVPFSTFFETGLLFSVLYLSLAGLWALRGSSVSTPILPQGIGITDRCKHVQVYVDSGAPNSGPHACMVSLYLLSHISSPKLLKLVLRKSIIIGRCGGS